MIKRDLQRAYFFAKGSRVARIIECFRSPGVHAVVVFRLAHWLIDQPFLIRLLLKPLVILEQHRIRSRWGVEIGADAKIGAGFFIRHYGGIFVAGDTIAGENLTLTHDITIGYSRARTIQGFPIIGHDVYIAPGAKLAGNIKIGDNAKIGSNAVVERDIPDNAVVQIRPMLVVTFQSGSGEDSMCG